jgi:two-component system phosphate regulon sensor histidine kinase PhoR
MGVVEPSRWRTVLSAAHYGPLAVVGPLLCMGLGAVVLRRLVRPVADVERQLRRVAVAPSVVDCELEEVEVRGAAALGWNRLVEHRGAGHTGADLHQRLSQSLEGVRYRKLLSILNSLCEGVLTTDPDGLITYHNASAVALLERRQLPRGADAGDEPASAPPARGGAKQGSSGASPAAADTQPPSSQQTSLMGDLLVTWLDRAWRLPADSPLLDPGATQRATLAELERDTEGERRVLRVTRTPCRAADGHEQEGHVWTLRDVTQQKLAEEMRTQFVDTATHELRTPLANIKAYAETLALQEMLDIEQQKDFLNTINSEATRLARFVDDLLSVSSMEIGSLSLSRQPTDLERLFTNVIGKVKPQTADKDITFETHFPEKWPEPELDKEKIAATLVNLLGNAVKYTPRGGRVALRVKVADGQLEISVEDTGIGISADDIPKLFDKFFRSNDPRVHEETGTGLGLSLAYEVVRLHGGKITVDSELNKGSTFLVTLPLK